MMALKFVKRVGGFKTFVKMQEHIGSQNHKVLGWGWSPKLKHFYEVKDIMPNPAIKHNYSKAEKTSAYRSRGKRVAGGYLDMNGELVRFG